MAAGVIMHTNADTLKVEALAWPHAANVWTAHATRTVATLPAFHMRRCAPARDVYGGDPARVTASNGFFRTAKIAGRWWLVDPAGHLFITVGLCSVTPKCASDTARSAFAKAFGGEQAWANATADLLWEHGFNGLGAWSADTVMSGATRRLVYAPIWNFMSSYGKRRGGTHRQPGHTGYPHDAMFVFDPEFEAFALEHARQLAACKDDPWLLGHFSDNELPFKRSALDNFLSLDSDEHGYQAARRWLDERRGTNAPLAAATEEDRAAFAEYVAERYFSIVAKAIRHNDPHHLFLGCRFYGEEKTMPGVWRAAGRHADVVSVNLYLQWTPDAAWLANWERWSGKPVMITEFYAKGADAGMLNETGAGFLVRTQRDRGLFYQNFTLGLLAARVCVGWHLFKYTDNDPDDPNAEPSNRNSNKGLLTSAFKPHTDYLQELRALNWNVYDVISYIDSATDNPPATHP